MDVVGETAELAGLLAFLDDGGGELVVAGEIIFHAMDQLGRLLRGEHAAMARRAVHHDGKGRDEMAGVDDDDVGLDRAQHMALRDQAVAHHLEIGMSELVAERRLIGAIARRMRGEENPRDAAGAVARCGFLGHRFLLLN